MKFKRHTKTHEIEYDLKTVLIRLFILIIILYLGINFIFNNNDDDTNLIEKPKYEIYQEQIEIDRNSRGNFFSLNEKIYVQGKTKIENNKILINNFKITNSKSFNFYIATNKEGSNRIFIEKLKTNIGNLEIEIQDNINTEIHDHLIIWDEKINKTVAYSLFE